MKRNALFVFALVLSMFLIIGVNSAFAQQQFLYAADGAGGNNATLMILNPATGEVEEVIGPTGFSVTGMAFSPDGVLYGVTGSNDPVYPRLIRINTLTGAGTPVDPAGTGFGGDLLTDISFSPQGTAYGWAINSYNLAWVNETTSLLYYFAPPGVGNPTSGGGLAFVPNGTLYLSADADNGPLYSLNTVTGASTLVTNLQGGNGWVISGMSANNTGTLYGMRGHVTIGTGPVTVSDLITINTTNGAIASMGDVTNAGVNVPRMSAIAFSPIVADVRTGFWVPTGELNQGSGVFIEIQRNTMALGWGAFTDDGFATYYFSTAGRVGTSDLFSGPLLSFANGPTFAGPPAPGAIISQAGTITVTFTNNTTANITGLVNGAAFNKTINKTFGE